MPGFRTVLGGFVVAALLVSCSSGSKTAGGPSGSTSGSTSGSAGGDSALAGTWRVLSSRLDYDAGGAGVAPDATRHLELRANGRWEFGSSSGSWSVRAIDDADWSRWGVDSYGPTRKIVLAGWNGSEGDGPIEESSGGVDFVWVIYRVGPPVVSAAGQVQMKFGRA